jgi:hypothetical protein
MYVSCFTFFSRLKIEPGEAGPNRYQESPYPMVFVKGLQR